MNHYHLCRTLIRELQKQTVLDRAGRRRRGWRGLIPAAGASGRGSIAGSRGACSNRKLIRIRLLTVEPELRSFRFGSAARHPPERRQAEAGPAGFSLATTADRSV